MSEEVVEFSDELVSEGPGCGECNLLECPECAERTRPKIFVEFVSRPKRPRPENDTRPARRKHPKAVWSSLASCKAYLSGDAGKRILENSFVDEYVRHGAVREAYITLERWARLGHHRADKASQVIEITSVRVHYKAPSEWLHEDTGTRLTLMGSTSSVNLYLWTERPFSRPELEAAAATLRLTPDALLSMVAHAAEHCLTGGTRFVQAWKGSSTLMGEAIRNCGCFAAVGK